MNKKRFGFSFLSGALLALGVVVSCTVTSSGGDPNGGCTPGRSAACTCSDGERGTQTCNSDGDGYETCVCEGGEGGTSAGGATNGTGGENYAGETSTPTAGAGGADPIEGGAGGQTAGGAGGEAHGGAGGSGGEPPVCEQAENDCEQCYYQQCCAQLEACLANEQCVEEFVAMRDCSNEVVNSHGTATPADVDDCAPNPNGGNHWPGNHASETIALIDCMNGGVGWENANSWPEGTCTACYN
jgi:hypothetical protein